MSRHTLSNSRASVLSLHYESSGRREIRHRFFPVPVLLLVRVGRAVVAVGIPGGNGIEHCANDSDREAVKHVEFCRCELSIGNGWSKDYEHAAGGRAEC